MELLSTVSILPSSPATGNAGVKIDQQPTAASGETTQTREAAPVLSDNEPATDSDAGDTGSGGGADGRGQLIDIKV